MKLRTWRNRTRLGANESTQSRREGPPSARPQLALPSLSEVLTSASDYGVIITVAALFIFLSIFSQHFLSPTNLLNILYQWSPIGIVACAVTIVLIGGGFDLSVSAISALSGVIAAIVVNSSSVGLGILAGLGVGLGLGIINGLLTTVLRIHSFIGTLASGIIIRGIALIITGGFLISVTDKQFSVLGRGDLLGAKWPIYVFAAVIVIATFVLSRTVFGRYTYAVGGNVEAARLSGIPVNLVKASTYAISGFAAGLAGVILASEVSTGQSDASTGMEMTAIAAVVLGGNSIMGGDGAIWRTVLGILTLALIGNGLNLLNVDPIYQRIAEGGIILFAIAVHTWSRLRGAARA